MLGYGPKITARGGCLAWLEHGMLVLLGEILSGPAHLLLAKRPALIRRIEGDFYSPLFFLFISTS